MLLSLILFGSKARGDDRRNSDVDLLGIADGGAIRLEGHVRGVSQYRYPFGYLKAKASEGDLFLAHLVHEGKILHDTASAFAQVVDAFTFRPSYENEVQIAHSIISFMAPKRRLIRTKAQRARLVWAIRTLLVARQAERGSVSFASKSLEEFSGIRGLKKCIDDRNTGDIDVMSRMAEAVADAFGSDQVHMDYPADEDLQRAFLRELGGIAEDTALIFLPPPRRRKERTQARTPLGYATFEPE